VLKAPDTSEMNEAVARLTGRGIPVVTLVTDLPRSPRTAYIGIDNRAAGATAAYLLTQWLGRRPGAVLVTLSRSFFRGEEERETARANLPVFRGEGQHRAAQVLGKPSRLPDPSSRDPGWPRSGFGLVNWNKPPCGVAYD
jgi:ABC-type sugar transport system substrate-binding protein